MRAMVEPQSVQPTKHLDYATGHGGPALARTMGLFALVVYGVGDMVATPCGWRSSWRWWRRC
jgi:hypothetical protein